MGSMSIARLLQRCPPRLPGFFSASLSTNFFQGHMLTSTKPYVRLYSAPARRTKEELLELVGQYDDESAQEHYEFLRDPYLRRYAPSDGPNIRISEKDSDTYYPSYHQTLNSEHCQAIVDALRLAIFTRWHKPELFDAEQTYEIYRALPQPRMLHLTGRVRHQLLAALAGSRPRDSKGMLRYFSVIGDVKDAGLSLLNWEWNTAISYASRYVGKSTDVETEAALRLWREMEHEAGVKANDVTLNILFDVASKAGNFSLAEMIYREMIVRGFKFNRYHHVSLIHYFGLKMDSGGVRAAYKEMVEAGERIDSVVLNCVIASLIRCGEEASALEIYERMKETHVSAPELPKRDYFTQKVVTKVFTLFSRSRRKRARDTPSEEVHHCVTPDLATYRILVNHFAVTLGDLNRVAKLLDEMKYFNIHLHGAIFLALFKGFHAHGGFQGAVWNEQRLEGIWEAFLKHYDEGVQGLYISTWMAIYVLRAYAKCSTRLRVMEVYRDLSDRWELDEVNEDFMIGFLHNLLKREFSTPP